MLADVIATPKDLQLPLSIRLGDTPSIDLAPNPRVTLTVRDPSILSVLTEHPSLDALGEGLADRVQLERMDYRNLPEDGRFDTAQWSCPGPGTICTANR